MENVTMIIEQDKDQKIELKSIVAHGVNISYKVNGSGPPLVYLHGWIGDEDSFEDCRQEFGKYFTVYNIAWPGYGESESLPGFTYEDLVAVVKDFIDQMQLQNITLIGNCLGGNIAQEISRLYPELFRSMVLVELHAIFPNYFLLLRIPGFKWLIYYILLKSSIGLTFLNLFFPMKKKEDSVRRQYVFQGFQKTKMRSALDFIRASHLFWKGTHRTYKDQLRVHVPVIYVEGEKTFGAVAAFKEMAKIYYSNLTILRIPGSLHNPIAESPQEFSQQILKLLKP